MSEPDPRTYLAAERTLLAWIRTGLAMMGFGFVVARFGLFLRELVAARNEHPVHQGRFSLSIGVALVLFGVVTTALAALRHRQVVRRLQAGQPIGDSMLPVLFAFILALAGIAMAAYLVLAAK
jgi:putative membrane protein